jgi:cell division septum initiation protein DivIVA
VTATQTANLPQVEPGMAGLPQEQVQAWLNHVQADMREVRTRIEYLRAEQSRLESQQRLLAELLTSSAT